MFQLRLHEMFAQKGILRPYNQLLKIGIGRSAAQKMLKGKAVQIRLDYLYILCNYFNCTPKELLKIVPTADGRTHENTPLQDWVAQPDILLAHELQQLTPTEMEEMKAFYKEMKQRKKVE